MEDAAVALEQHRPLSQSLLWDLQRRYFGAQCIEAWRKGTVPHYITSNAFIAQAYAQIVLGFLLDCRGDADAFPAPLHIIELGAGHGRFGYHFLTKFRELLGRSALDGAPFHYVMSDLSDRNVEFWRSHPRLQPLVEEGILDFARFDPLQDEGFALVHSGETLSPGAVDGPMAFIANYFLDGIPQDAFGVEDGVVHEGLVTVTSSQPEPDLTDPEILSRVSLSYDYEPARADHYDDPDWNRILHGYAGALDQTAFLFPTGALQCVANLRRLSGDRMLLISADKGDSSIEQLQGRGEPKPSIHGSFSLAVNYDAIGEYVDGQGGLVLHPKHRPPG